MIPRSLWANATSHTTSRTLWQGRIGQLRFCVVVKSRRRKSRSTIILSVKRVKKWEADPKRYHLGRQRWSMLRSEQQGLPNLPLRR